MRRMLVDCLSEWELHVNLASGGHKKSFADGLRRNPGEGRLRSLTDRHRTQS